MKRILLVILSLAIVLGCASFEARAEEEGHISYMIQSDYEHVNLSYESEKLSGKVTFRIGETVTDAEYTYLNNYQADIAIDEAWINSEVEVSVYNGDTVLESSVLFIPYLDKLNNRPFELKAHLTTANGDDLTFVPQMDQKYLFLPSGTDLSRISFEYDSETIKNVTVTNALAGDSFIMVYSGVTANLSILDTFGKCTAQFYRFGYQFEGQSYIYVVGIMISKNVDSVFFVSDNPETKGREYIDSSPDHSTKAKGNVTIYSDTLNQLYTGVVSAIKGRGNTTWNWTDKKSYQIKLDKKADLLDPENGTQKAKKWILLGNPYDGTLLRNQLFYSLAYKAGLLETPEGRSVDFYYDGEYRGTYYLCEKVEVGEGRIEIDDLEKANEKANPDIEDFDALEEAEGRNKYRNVIHYETGMNNPANITGGYLIEIDNAYGASEKSYFVYKNNPVPVVSPEYCTLEEITYISEFFAEAFNSVFDGGVNSTTGKSYDQYFDLDSLVRYFMIQQFGKNVDVFASSTFFYKPKDADIVYSGPVWDMDSTCGSRTIHYSTTGWRETGMAKELVKIDSFMQAMKEFYNGEFRQLIKTEILDDNPDGWISKARENEATAAMNFTVWGHYDALGTFQYRESYWQNVTDMFNWLYGRIDWMDSVMSDTVITRIAGDSRYETSLKIADELKSLYKVDKFDTIILASGLDFPDALSSAYLSSTMHAPILLIGKSGRKKIINYINSNLAENGQIIVLGGESAVSESYLTDITGKITRLSGEDRYLTNLKILEYIGTDVKELLVCTGRSYADCLSVSAVSIPILLVKDKLTNKQKKYLDSLNLENIYVIGGSAAVNEDIEQQLKAYGTVTRIWGEDRQKTSLAVAEYFFPDSDKVVFAYSHNFPDGLCGGALASYLNAPVLLAKSSTLKKYRNRVRNNNIKNGYVMGGETLIDDESIKNLYADMTPPYIVHK